jgi:hypothetical protein
MNHSNRLATTLFFVFWLCFAKLAVANECGSLIILLKDLQKAQRSVSDSLIQNHYMMGDTLESYSETMRDSRGKAYEAIAKNMGKAGQSFKARAEKATGHSSLIADNTSEIISLAEKCISVK